jgi:transcriptional regulator with XRE-family HTH domain
VSRVGIRIQDAREKAGISVKQLSKKLGVSESFLCDIEGGKRILNEEHIKRIEKILNVNLNEDIFKEVEAPVENLKEVDNSKKNVNKQWEDAFSHILKKIPICDISFKEIIDYKYLPIVDKKIEGYNADKITYIVVPDDSMRGLRIQKGDKIMLFQNSEIVNNSISLIEIEGKRCIRQVKRLDANKALIISHSSDLKTETRDIRAFAVIGRCVRLEVEL